jgi:hypothetical protein
VAFGRTHRRHRAMRCDCCFRSCKPEARRQGFIEPNGCRGIAGGGDAPTFDVVITSDIIIARPSRPSHQLG